MMKERQREIEKKERGRAGFTGIEGMREEGWRTGKEG
jgi:hypothetical protein